MCHIFDIDKICVGYLPPPPSPHPWADPKRPTWIGIKLVLAIASKASLNVWHTYVKSYIYIKINCQKKLKVKKEAAVSPWSICTINFNSIAEKCNNDIGVVILFLGRVIHYEGNIEVSQLKWYLRKKQINSASKKILFWFASYCYKKW